MMIKAVFNDEMVKIIRDMKGKTFKSFEAAPMFG